MKSGFNPTRRNRNIGTAKQGFGQNNRLVIPRARYLLSVLDWVGDHTRDERVVQGKCITFIIEKPRSGSVHPCTVNDVAQLLNIVPASDWVGIRTVVFRQPTRKQAILNPAWGRLRYSGQVSTAQGRIVAIGPMILLDAIDEQMRIRWPSALGPDDRAELERLRADGHTIQRKGPHHTIAITPFSARNTQLYRTLLHEVGHWFDWLENVEGPALRSEAFETLTERYFSRPIADREAFAHRYAESMRKRLTDFGLVPFSPA